MMRLFSDRSHWQHFGWAIPIGLLLTILCVLGVASGMEWKDYRYGNRWDWSDFNCTMLGGVVGQVLQLVIILQLW